MAASQNPDGLRGRSAEAPQRTLEFSRHERWLRTVIFSRLGDSRAADAVDDVLQEVALAAVAVAPASADPMRWASWLYRVAVRQALLYRRRQGRRRKMAERFAERGGPDAGPGAEYDPLGLLLREERKQIVAQAVTRLRRRDAEILLLKYTEGWSYRQMAEHLGLTESAVETRIHRARQRLRGELASLELTEVRS